MKLHLPKTLLAAVIGVMTMSPLHAVTVTIKNSTTNAALNPSDYDNLTSSDTLIFALTDTSSNRFWSSSGTINANIVIGSDTVANSGMYIYNGYTNIDIIYTGTVTGSGTMSKKDSGTNNHWKFRGNVSGFSGAIWLQTSTGDKRQFYLDFENAEGSAEPANAQNVSGTGTITFASGTDAADDSGGNWLTYNYTTSVHTAADNPLTVGNVITRSSDNIQSRVEIKGTAAMKFTNTVTLAKLKLSTNTQDVTLTSGLVENITGTTGHTIRKTGTGELTIGNTTGNNLVVSEGKLKIKQGATASFANVSVTGGTMEICGTFHMTEAVNVAGGSLNVKSGAWLDTSELNGVYAWNEETSMLTYAAEIGTGWTIDSGAIIGLGGGFEYNSTTGNVVTEVAMKVVSAETFTWGGDTPGSDDAGDPLASSGSCVRFAGDSTQSVTLAAATSTPFLLIAKGTNVTMTRGANTFTADAVCLEGSLRIDNNTGYTVSRWDGEGELILGWGDFRDNAASIANFSGNLRIAAGTGLRICDAGRTFSKVTVENGAFFCINNDSKVDSTHHHVGDIYISGDGLGTNDHIGALKLGDGRRMLGNVHIVDGSASISSWRSEHGYIDGDIIGEGGNTTTLKTLNAELNGNGGQLLDVENITGVATVNLSSGTLTVSRDVTNNKDSVTQTGGGFAKVGNGTLIINRNVTLDSSLSVQAGTLVIQGEGTVNVAQPSDDYAGQLELWDNGTLKIAGGRDIGTLTISGQGTLGGGTLNIANGSIGLQANENITLQPDETRVLTFKKRAGVAETIVLGDGTNRGTLNIANGNKITYDPDGSGLSVTATSNNSSVSGTGGHGLSVAAEDQTFTNLTVGTSADTNVAATLTNSGLDVTAGTATITTAQDAVSSVNVSSGATIITEEAVTVTGDASISGTATLNANLTVEGSTTLAGTDASIVIGDRAAFTTGNEVITNLLEGSNATISGTGTVSVATAGITYTNADITVNTADSVTTAATLSSSKLTVTGGGTVMSKVEEGTTNDFDASAGNVAVNTGSDAVTTVGELNVGTGKEATFTTDDKSKADIVVSGTADVAGTVSANVNVASASETQKATFTAESGATVGGNLTVNATTGSLVLTTIGTSDSADGVLSVANTLTATLTDSATNITLRDNVKAEINTAMTALTEKGGTVRFLLAKAGTFSIDGLGGTGTVTLSDAQLGLLGIEPVANVTYTLAAVPPVSVFSSRAAESAQSLLMLTGTHPLTETSVVSGDAGVRVDGTHITLTVADNIDDMAGNFNVIVGKEAWENIVEGLNGNIYQNAFVFLKDANGGTLNLATYDGKVTLNGDPGTGIKGEYFVAYIPEPTTATLSLLALAALAARRRRRF